jgi:hypothetical protein
MKYINLSAGEIYEIGPSNLDRGMAGTLTYITTGGGNIL